MFSASKFWPSRLLGSRDKPATDERFVPATAAAARIVGQAESGTPAWPEPPLTNETPPPPTSFDGFPAFAPPAAAPAAMTQAEADAIELARQAERFVPTKTMTTLIDNRGKTLRARIINISATGVAIEADFAAMPVGTIAFVGQKPVTPGRAIRRGQVFIFNKPLDPARCNPQIVL